MLNGFLDLPWWGYVLATLGLTHITIASVTIYLHRHQAHRGLELHPSVAHFFRFWLWLTTGMVTAEWVAVHRKHHARCETEDDPHSPIVKGLSTVMWRGSELYREEAAREETVRKYAHGTPNDWIERHVYGRYPFLGITLMAVIDVALFGAIGLTIWAIQMVWIPFWAAGVINGVGHYWGYRNFEPSDASTNLTPWGILVGGEELHNNHHAFPSSAKFALRRGEFDLGWAYIRGLERVGLARVKRVAPKPVIAPGKQEIDRDTVSAVVVNRLHVLARYGREVVLPTVREELHRADQTCRKLYRPAKRLLIREDSLINERQRNRLQQVLSRSQQLELVYEYKQRLQALWARSSHSHETLRKQLADWCAQAEASGVRALQDFARSLRGYTLAQPA
ncbi:fatty acid desaturase [Alkalilimnicola sp. S0819]|uniref:DesA family fatty acid desaturase n=1 Tax=Alkalilimnicola sp. S0819 TaxID=2613922 RepID=UPI0012628163|nr:fatty acid desaturase [Alkalilimnicola sp. S0819]KAB7627350.1 acyl-CoA desaturase [Alkalilimnicola sp. S0819]MPQ16067.1 acyl-CoA desaturase [Alkalilimnicola sp. S0819]